MKKERRALLISWMVWVQTSSGFVLPPIQPLLPFHHTTTVLQISSTNDKSTLTAATSSSSPALDTPPPPPPPPPELLLPPRPAKLGRLEQEFRDKCATFVSYTDQDVALISNPRLRLLFEGVIASTTEPPVYRAFEVLFEDIAPVRLAGRAVYRQLTHKMEQAKQLRKQYQAVLEEQGFSDADVATCLAAYQALSGPRQFLTRQQLLASGAAARTVADNNSTMTPEEWVSRFPGGRIEMHHLLAVVRDTLPPEPPLPQLLHRIARSVDTSPPLEPKKAKFAARYDAMVEQFREWEQYIPSNEGRMYDVLRGCFVGANNPQIVGALRIVYIDYVALRLAGDVIFKLMASIARRKAK